MCPSMLSIESRKEDLYMFISIHVIPNDLPRSKHRLKQSLKEILHIHTIDNTFIHTLIALKHITISLKDMQKLEMFTATKAFFV
jgi:hypothetical protein